MPFAYRKEEAQIAQTARELFAQGITSPAKIRDRLEQTFSAEDVPSWRTLHRWCKAWREQQENSIIASAQALAEDTGDQEFIQTEDPLVESRLNVQVIPPPDLPDLIEQGVPGNAAVRLLANWDIAYQRRHGIQTLIYQRAVGIFAEFPDIPYNTAVATAGLDVKGDLFNIQWVKDMARFGLRYRMWQGPENRRAFLEVMSRTYPDRFRPRARQAGSFLTRLFERGASEE